MKRFPITPEAADRSMRQMFLLWEINRVFFKEASPPQRSAAAIERDKQRRQEAAQQNEAPTPADKD